MSGSPARFIMYRSLSEDEQGAIGPETIEAWPAAGGGLLVGVAEPAFAAKSPLRGRMKTVFIRIAESDMAALILPYVTLEYDVADCVRTLIAEELCVPEGWMEIRATGPADAPGLADISPSAERSLLACAAAARSLLVSAAAERWELPPETCRISDGEVIAAERRASYRTIAADAALCALPGSVRLRCGHHVSLTSPLRGHLAFVD